jgi:hypothetical protein
MNFFPHFLQILRSPLSGSGNAYVIAIIGAVAAGSYLLTGGLMPRIEQNPINPQHVEIDDTSIAANKDTLQLVNIQPKPSATPTSPQLTPQLTPTSAQCIDNAAVAIVVDTSGSMHAIDPGQTKTRIQRLKEALKDFLTFFKPDDSAISLITFANEGAVAVPFGKLSQNGVTLNTAIDAIVDDGGGSTNMKAGLEKAIGELDAAKITYPDYNQFTVFMSDGLPESGDCKYRQYSGTDGYDNGPYNWYTSGDPKTTGIVPPLCVLEGTNTQPTFFTHKWSPIEPGRVIKRTGKLFSLSMRQEPNSNDPDYVYEKDKYDKTESLMKAVASNPDATYYISSPTTENLTAAYQVIAKRICPAP